MVVGPEGGKPRSVRMASLIGSSDSSILSLFGSSDSSKEFGISRNGSSGGLCFGTVSADSTTGILHFLNQTTVTGYLQKQPTVALH